ncbi:carbohydrate-binding protein [Cohnella sp. CFH 77786]|uniref:CBM35 domain-containing protein n=1 Tax=Cohnella sp. CFH 77786 TaxID=2662265 RepID=UPI001C60DD63|nr:CBM35 domain-containing protein [Cohnella sp. CFH 77786]MBW5449257.1 carbohydrate-binding protein [Cohnella sp. CFH 77786]
MIFQKIRLFLTATLTGMLLFNMIPAPPAYASTTMPSHAAVYQAENAALSGTAKVATDHTGYTGTGFAAGFDFSSTAKTTFTVTVGTSGDFFIDLRYSAGKVAGWPDNRTVGLVVNGVSQGSITLAGTNTWEAWADDVRTVPLNAGTNTIAFTALTANDNSDSINLDKLTLWKDVANPVVYALKFDQSAYTVTESGSVQTTVREVYTDETVVDVTADSTFSSSDPSKATVSAAGFVEGVSPGSATITAHKNGNTATAGITIQPDPTVTVDFAKPMRQVDRSMFGYILTPNYDVPDSRMTLLGPLMNRETIPAQNFQAVGDGNNAQYQVEESVLARSLEAYKRATDNGMKWYFLIGLHPSWTAPNNNPWGGPPANAAWFKQYTKDVIQFYKDNGAKIDIADLTNENWTGNTETYKNVWNALREVYPEAIPTVGPGGVSFGQYQSAKFWLPFASQNNISIEGPSWHDFWESQSYASLEMLKGWNDTVKSWQNQYPETNGKYRIWEENNSSTTDPANWTRDMANVINSGITHNVKGVMQNYNWNGMSDLLQTNKTQQNPGFRTSMWWVHYMFSQLSGEIVSASTDDAATAFTAVASKDRTESKIILVNNGMAGNRNIILKNQPYSGQNVRVDLYQITSSESDGLTYQSSITPASTDNIQLSLSNIGANESWLLVLKKTAFGAPSFFHPIAPDDGEVATSTPALTWTAAKDASTYTLKVSVNKDLSNPVIHQTGITGTSYTVGSALTIGQKYYWNVTAVNANGSTPVSNNAVYSFLAGANTNVPAQFGPYLPSTLFSNESTTPKFLWSKAYNATSYRLVLSTNSDLSNPVINQTGITSLVDTPQFGAQTAGTFQPAVPLANDTKYYWMVYAANAAGERPMNGPVQSFTTKPASGSPTSFGLTAPANGAASVSTRAVLSWQQPKNAFFYKLEVSPSADMTSPIIVRDRMIYNKYTFEPNMLNPGTTYYWRVTAYTKDLANSTAASNGIFSFTTEAVPSSPLLYAEKADNGKVKLWFQPSNGATSYKIKYGKAPGVYTHTITGVTGSPYEVTGLTNGTNYYFAVVAVNASGDSSIWNERTATPTYRGQDDVVFEAEYETLNGTKAAADHTRYTGTGFVAGYDLSGTRSTVFKATVAAAGAYNVVARYSAGPVGTASVNRTIGLYVNGAKVKDVTLGGTGDWETWAESPESISLQAGTNIIEYRGELASQNDCINLDNLSISAQPTGIVVPTNAAVYQAEDAALSGTAKVATDHTGYTGTGFAAGYDFSGTASTVFTVKTHSSGDFQIALRYSAGKVSGWPDNRTVGLLVNNVNLGSITLPGTDSTWNTWADDVRTVQLHEGTNTIAFTALTANDNSDSINLDKLSLWKNVDNPQFHSIEFGNNAYTVNESGDVQTSVQAVKTDETVQDVTASSQFSTSDPEIATVNASGKIHGVREGTATVTARYNGASATATVTVNPRPELVVDLATVTKETADHAGSGALYAFRNDGTPRDQAVIPLRPKMIAQPPANPGMIPNKPYEVGPVGDAIVVAPAAKRTGIEQIQIYMSDTYPNFPQKWVSWDDYYSRLDAEVDAVLNSPYPQGYFVYIPWNEPDWTWNNPINSGDSFNVAFKKMFDRIKAKDKVNLIEGPNIAVYSHDFMLSFLTYCKEKGCLPDIISFHSLETATIPKFESEVDDVRAIMKSLGIPERPISINEYVQASDLGKPGITIQYLAKFERKLVDSAAMPFWFKSGSFGDTLTGEINIPNGNWWLFKFYGDMTGKMLKTTPPSGSALDGMASRDDNSQQVKVVSGGASGDYNIVLDHVAAAPYLTGNVHVVIHKTINTGSVHTKLTEPIYVSQGEYAVTDGKIKIPMLNLSSEEAYQFIITPSAPGATNTPGRYQAEYAQLDGTAKVMRENAGYDGTGYVAGYQGTSSANTRFVVGMEQDGLYSAKLHYSAGPVEGSAAYRTLGLYVNHKKVKDIALPGTADWHSWSTVSNDVFLQEGVNIIEYKPEATGKSSDVGLDYLDIAPAAASVYQAEAAVLSGTAAAASDHAGFTGTGFVAGYNSSDNARTEFTVHADLAGDYNLALRYSAGEQYLLNWPADRTIGLYVNGIKVKDIRLKGTVGWTEWDTDIQTVPLAAGDNKIAYKALTSAADNSDAVNLDKLTVWQHDLTAPTATVSYSQTTPTNQDVIASITASESVTIVTNGGLPNHTFSSNGSFTFEFVDAAGNLGSIEATVGNIDKTAPLLTIQFDKPSIWPANHQMVTVQAAVYASDDASGLESVVITSITSNEPDSGQGDIEAKIGSADTSFALRAERSGHETGRVYTVTYSATDKAGNQTVASATVTVPHDQSGKNKPSGHETK